MKQPRMLLLFVAFLLSCVSASAPAAEKARPEPKGAPQAPTEPEPDLPLPVVPMKRIEVGSGTVSISVPEDWKVSPTGHSVTASPPGESTLVMVWCTPNVGMPFQQYVKQMLAAEKDRIPAWVKMGERTLQIAGRQAIQVRAQGEPKGVTTVADYTFIEGENHNITIILACSKSDAARHRTLFARILGSIQLAAAQAGPWLDPTPQAPPAQTPNAPAVTPPPVRPPDPVPQLPPLPFPDPADVFLPRPATPPQPQAPPAPAGMKTVSDPAGTFAFAVPADWQVQQQAGMTVATDPTQRARLEFYDAPRAYPSVADLAQAATQVWKQQTPGWTQVGEQLLAISSQPARRIRASTTAGGQPLTVDYILVVTAARQFVLLLGCPPQEAAQHQAAFEAIIRSLRVR